MTTGTFTAAWLDAHRVSLPPVPRESIVGIGHVLAEVDGVLARLADPDLVRELGLELPRGVLLHGQPGTGKTLVARYLASRLGPDVPFYEVAGDELSPDRVRGALRSVAARHPRSVLYIDEIDVVAERRDAYSHTPETKAVLVAMLAALDGVVPASGPILVASTNRHPSALDPALLRSGRIGIHIAFDAPDEDERHELFRLFVGGRPTLEPVDLRKAARLTRGETPADLRAMVDDGYGLAVAAGRRALSDADLVAAVRRAGSIGPQDATLDPEARHRSAIHESGHVAVAVDLRGPAFASAVMLTPRGGRTVLGPDLRDTLFWTGDEVTDQVAAGLGGIAAERLLLDGGASLGGDDDVAQATQFALRLAAAGLLPELSPLYVDSFGQALPESVKQSLGDAVVRLLDSAQETATSIVASRLEGVATFAAVLERAGELTGTDLQEAIAAAFGPAVVGGAVSA